MAIAHVDSQRGFHAGGASSLSTASLAASGANLFMRAFAFIGTGSTPADPTSVVWNASEGFTSYQAGTTFASFFRANPWHLKAPTATTAVVTATWAASHDETMLLASCYSEVDQTTTTRTATSPASAGFTAWNVTASLSVTSVSGDTVVGSAAIGDTGGGATTISSATVTVRTKVEGADIGGFEACAQGDTTASGTSTTASFVFAGGGSAGADGWYCYGVSLIPASAAAPEAHLTLLPMAPPLGMRR